MFETFSTSALEMIDKALRIAKSLGKNFSELLGNKLPEHLKSGGIPPFFRVRP